jgi:hypothetical protein
MAKTSQTPKREDNFTQNHLNMAAGDETDTFSNSIEIRKRTAAVGF